MVAKVKVKKPIKKESKLTTKPKAKVVAKPAFNKAQFTDSAKTYFKAEVKKAKTINFEKFLTDAWNMMLHPVKYFTSIKTDGRYENAIVKVLMYGLLTAGLKILFNLGSITLVGAVSSIVLMPIYAILITFGFAGMMLFFSYLAKGEMNFETSMKAVASCIFMYPLSFVAYQLAFSYWILLFFSLVIDLYIVFLIYTATTSCLKGEKRIAQVIFGIFAAFVVLIHFSTSGALYVSNKNPQVGFKYHFVKMQRAKGLEMVPMMDVQK